MKFTIIVNLNLLTFFYENNNNITKFLFQILLLNDIFLTILPPHLKMYWICPFTKPMK